MNVKTDPVRDRGEGERNIAWDGELEVMDNVDGTADELGTFMTEPPGLAATIGAEYVGKEPAGGCEPW